ncbi:MAG: hypothetical protein C5B51_30210 [Terriglobia bacterium]|nr:MAG: hypothetical protein C5B51_30210 [Terriglobia bacterium]
MRRISALGWVGRFHQYLASYLTTNLGEEAQIWRDDRLRGNDLFANEIVKQFPKTAALISILSQRYLKSEWCLKEVHEFCRVAQEAEGLTVDDKTRVLRVMLRPISDDHRKQLPGALKDALGYKFYQESEGGHILPLDPAFGSAEAYRTRIYTLAQDIAELIEKLEESQSTAGPPAVSKPVVYLAESGYDRAEDREKIRAELRSYGYPILPDARTQFSDLEKDYVEQVNSLLDQCQFSIHPVGSFRGKVPDGAGHKSVVQLQNDLAVGKSRTAGLRRVIWLPEGTRSEHAEHSAFLEALQRDANLQYGADLIAGDLEELKSAIRAGLKKLENPRLEPPVSAGGGAPLVYFICVEEDLESAVPLIEFLTNEGFAIELPVFSGDATEVRQANEAVAASCQAVLLFFGAGGGAWKYHQQSELKRIQASRREPLRVSFTYLAGPPTADKKVSLLKKEPGLINGLEGFAPEKLSPFLAALRPGRTV